MSAATIAHPAALAPRSLERPGLARLTAVELRKMTDTRAGFWLQLAVVALTVVVVAAACLFARPEDQTLRSMLSIAVAPASVLLPIVGILLVSSEWSQRTGMITFALVPRRARVIAAKLLASVVLSLVALALCVVVALVGTAVAAPGLDHTWALPVGLLGQHVVSLGTGMISGVALGAALLASAPAIVCQFALPLAWALAGRLAGLDTVVHWLDPHVLAGADDRAPDGRHRVGARGDHAGAVDGAAARRRAVAHPARRDPLSGGRRLAPPWGQMPAGPSPPSWWCLPSLLLAGGDARRLRAPGALRLRPVRRPGRRHAARLQRADADRRARDRSRRAAPRTPTCWPRGRSSRRRSPAWWAAAPSAACSTAPRSTRTGRSSSATRTP